MSGWRWKEKDGTSGGLRYEPGNWGDIVKGEWLLRVLTFLAGGADERATVANRAYLDPFAGLPAYPASATCRARMMRLPTDLLLPPAAEPYLRNNRWPAACTLTADRLSSTPTTQLATNELWVYDQDDARRKALEEAGRFRVAPQLESGWQMFPPAEIFRLILVDPYDVLAEWREVWPAVRKTAEQSPVLLYAYNRSGRGKEQERNYRAFRSAVRESGQPAFWGRVAADSFLPDCWHEMVSFPAYLREKENFSECVRGLERATRQIDQAIRDAGVFGEFSGD